jgi:DNA transformation protein
MKKDQGLCDLVVEDLLNGKANITSRAMFGGWGLYKDGKIFGIIGDGVVYLKLLEAHRAAFEKLGSQPFRYSRKDGKATTMGYWSVPEEVLEDREVFGQWVGKCGG